ncbi:hypothetical protein CI15_20405 [Paraburkholderia monticola]|uniref:EamA domain-containing protein n=2 Tax=Paraburkholderia monticola TaxID=1399968 RepID=A0A149PKG4_9BURK|nr:hypothetical protein CI15_20405 [Paraburkholderia monticola]
MLFGVWLMMSTHKIGLYVIRGSAWGIASGFTFALMQLVSRVLVEEQNPIKIAAYQNSIATLILLPMMRHVGLPETAQAIAALFFWGVICTALAHTLFIAAMRHVSVATDSMFTDLEPLYGSAIAALFYVNYRLSEPWSEAQ